MLLNSGLYRWHTRHAANEDNFVDLVNRLASVFKGFLARINRALDQISHKALKLCTAERGCEVLWFLGFHIHRDEWQVHLIRGCRGKLFLGFLSFLFQTL